MTIDIADGVKYTDVYGRGYVDIILTNDTKVYNIIYM